MGKASPTAVDRLMEQASAALAGLRYFEAERLADEALHRAWQVSDFERMARMVLPLQEARRQKRQAAVDAGYAAVLHRLPRRLVQAGCYLLQPPLVARDAATVRALGDAAALPVLVITREPMTREGLWPVVSASAAIVLRARVAPPWPLERVESSPTKDEMHGRHVRPPPRDWFERAEEAIGDTGLARLRPEEPAAWRVDDLMLMLEAHPTHEKLHQRLGEECRRALREHLPADRRHRPRHDTDLRL